MILVVPTLTTCIVPTLYRERSPVKKTYIPSIYLMKSYHIRMQPYGFDISILQQPLYLIYIGSEGQNKKSKHIKRRLCVVSNKMYPKEGGFFGTNLLLSPSSLGNLASSGTRKPSWASLVAFSLLLLLAFFGKPFAGPRFGRTIDVMAVKHVLPCCAWWDLRLLCYIVEGL